MRKIFSLPFPSLPSFPFPGSPFPAALSFLAPLSPPLPSPFSLPLEVGPRKSSYDVWGVLYVRFASRVWGRAPAEIEFNAF